MSTHAGNSQLKHVHTHKLTHTHAHQDALEECASTLCTSISTYLHIPRGELYTHSEQDTSLHTHLFTHIMALSILASTGCTCVSSSYRKSLVKRAEPFIPISVFLPPPILICPQCHPSTEAGLENAQRTLIQGTYLFREVSQWRLHTVAHNMLRLPFRWTWL